MDISKLSRLIDRLALEIHDPSEIEPILLTLIDVDWGARTIETRRKLHRREYARLGRAIKRSEKLGLEHTLTLDQWMQTLEHFKYRCAYCELIASYDHLEHFVPVKLGGGTTVSNCVPACRSCNSYKGRKDVRRILSLRQLSLFGLDLFEQRLKRVAIYLNDKGADFEKELDRIAAYEADVDKWQSPEAQRI